MNITFLIGNGFDLELGLKTRYMDFLQEYVKEKETDEDISYFKSIIQKDLSTWADAELAFGKYTADEKLMPVFNKCYTHFVESLAGYLRNQEERINYNQIVQDEIIKRVESAILDLSLNFNAQMLSVRDLLKYSIVDCQFIVFNYTNTFRRAIELFKEEINRKLGYEFSILANENNIENLIIGDTIHIHGSLNESMIFGVNDDSQIADLDEAKQRKIDRFLIKPYSNSVIHASDYKKAQRAIADSDLICIYGMSLGETDKYWWEIISEWLAADVESRLAIFTYCNECETINKRIKEHKNNLNSVSAARYFDQIDIEDELKEKQKEVSDNLKKKFLDYSKLGDAVKKHIGGRIHIMVNTNLFGGKIV